MDKLFSLQSLDHFVLTTAQPNEMEAFYSKLGFEVRKDGARYEILAPAFKINLHIKGHELEPKAVLAEPGTGDFTSEILIKILWNWRCILGQVTKDKLSKILGKDRTRYLNLKA